MINDKSSLTGLALAITNLFDLTACSILADFLEEIDDPAARVVRELASATLTIPLPWPEGKTQYTPARGKGWGITAFLGNRHGGEIRGRLGKEWKFNIPVRWHQWHASTLRTQGMPANVEACRRILIGLSIGLTMDFSVRESVIAVLVDEVGIVVRNHPTYRPLFLSGMY